MAREPGRNGEGSAADDAVRQLAGELLRAIEAEPVPPAVLDLARRLAEALAMPAGAEPVRLPPEHGSGHPD